MGPSVQLLLEPLSQEDYQSLLISSDIVLLPYDAKAYRVRGSGIVAEAAAAGKIIVASEDSYPGNVAAAYGGETGSSPEDFAEGVVKIASDFSAAKKRAAQLSNNYIAENGIDAYWRKCLDAERQES